MIRAEQVRAADERFRQIKPVLDEQGLRRYSPSWPSPGWSSAAMPSWAAWRLEKGWGWWLLGRVSGLGPG
jgi:hypothetical protein